ncbi:hypothetical protein ACWF9B_02975 [Streptomyces sp. NPDC055089]
MIPYAEGAPAGVASGARDFGPQARHARVQISEVVSVPLARLRPADSPRFGGEDPQHIQLLAGCEEPLPPILVHRRTMRVIDGTHRVRVAQLRGAADIAVQYFDGTEAEAFVLAVESNVRHGLPLSRAERNAAALRLLTSHPSWSDRAIAAAAGLTGKTVAAIRRRHLPDAPAGRVGRDGRVRPLAAEQGRERARDYILRNPEASLRETSSATGIAPGTVRDVRARLHLEQLAAPEAVRTGQTVPSQRRAADRTGTREPQPAGGGLLQTLCRDPSLRLTDAGRRLLRLLGSSEISTIQQDQLVESTPAHCAGMVSALAKAYAEAWAEFAERLEARCAEPVNARAKVR